MILNSVSQKIIILHKINKKKNIYFKQKCQASEKYVHLYALVGLQIVFKCLI